MKESTLLLAGGMIGLLTGIAIMYLLNGILGHASMKEAIIAFSCFEGIALFVAAMVFKKLYLIKPLVFDPPKK